MRIGKYEPSDKNTIGTAITFLLIGLGTGALAALLFAPKTGKQMRRSLWRKYEDAKERVDEWKEEAKEHAEEALDRSTAWAEELRETAREKVAPVREALRRG